MIVTVVDLDSKIERVGCGGAKSSVVASGGGGFRGGS